MNHSFNIEVATEYGMLEAVLMEHLNFWTEKNRANNVNFYDGHYWTYNSAKALSGLFPYVSKSTITRALHHLEEEGLVLSGNYNKSAYDRTTWYALTEKGLLVLNGGDEGQCMGGAALETDSPKMDGPISQNDDIHFPEWEIEEPKMGNSISKNDDIHFPKWEMEEPKMGNGSDQSEPPIPDINTDIETDNNLTVSEDTVCRTDVRRVMEQWNLLSDCGIRPVTKVSPETKRYGMLRARIRVYGIEKVLEAVRNIRGSSFLCGGNKSGWVITFDWFVRPNNFVKVLEGNYGRLPPPAAENTKGQEVSGSGYSQGLLDRLAGGGADG